MQLRQQCDLEALKMRYIQSITAKREVEVDQRIDCGELQLTVTMLERRNPFLGPPVSILLACLVIGFGLCIGLDDEVHDDLGRRWRPALADCWGHALAESVISWLFAVIVLDLISVLIIAAINFRVLQLRLAARSDQRWKRVEQRRAQKAEAMRAAPAPAPVSPRAETAASVKFDQHLAAFLAGKPLQRG